MLDISAPTNFYLLILTGILYFYRLFELRGLHRQSLWAPAGLDPCILLKDNEKKSLAQEDYVLYEALNLLKGMNIMHARMISSKP